MRGLSKLAVRNASLLMVVMVLAACGGESHTLEGVTSRANAAMTKGDFQGAIISLKEGLQRHPDSADLRLLLGKALLMSEMSADALVELEKARAGGVAIEQVGVDLARALFANRQFKRVVSEFGDVQTADVRVAAELKALSALAQIELMNPADAQASTDAALKLDPSNVTARLTRARFFAGTGKFDEALALLEAVIKDRPGSADALILKGDLLWKAKADKAGARQTYLKSVESNPRDINGHIGLIRLALSDNDLVTYGKQLEAIKSAFPKHPETAVRELEFAILSGSTGKMRERADALLKIAPDNARVLQLAGTVDLESGALSSAESRFQAAMKHAPRMASARLLLAQTYLRQGSPRKALATLRPLLEGSDGEVRLPALQTAAKAYLLMGDTVRAEEGFAILAKGSGPGPKVLTALALTRISNGRWDEGFNQLSELAQSTKTTEADYALINARMQRGEIPAALEAIAQLEKKDPKGAMPRVLRARAEARSSRIDLARASFTSALELIPDYYPAIEGLNILDVTSGRFLDAKTRLQGYLKKKPHDAQAILALVDVMRRLGEPIDAMASVLDAGINAAPDEADLKVARGELLLAQHKGKAALLASQEASQMFPNHPMVMDLMGRAHLAVGEREQGLSVLRSNAARNPTLAEPQLRLAEVYAAGNDVESARSSFRLALQNAPDALPVVSNWIKLELSGNRIREAKALAIEYQKSRPFDAAGYLLEADILIRQKNFGEAATRVQRALGLKPETETAVQLHGLLMAVGNQAAAKDFEERWLLGRPKDGVFLFHLAWAALGKKDLAGAEVFYRRVLDFDPKNPAALNNVASIMVQLGKSGALEVAQLANTLAPNQPAFMDTLASALALDKQVDKALALQRDVVSKAPNEPGFRLHLAKLLVQSGDRPTAKSELLKLQALGERFPGYAEVKTMLAAL